MQGEILEGLVARMVNHESSKYMEKVLRDFPPQPLEGGMVINLFFLPVISFILSLH